MVKDKPARYTRAKEICRVMDTHDISYRRMARLTGYSWGHLTNSLNGERLPSEKLLTQVEAKLKDLI